MFPQTWPCLPPLSIPGPANKSPGEGECHPVVACGRQPFCTTLPLRNDLVEPQDLSRRVIRCCVPPERYLDLSPCGTRPWLSRNPGLLPAPAGKVANGILRFAGPFIGGSAIPGHRFGITLLNSQSILVKPTEVDLRLNIPLLGSGLVPSRCLGIILFDSEPIVVEEP